MGFILLLCYAVRGALKTLCDTNEPGTKCEPGARALSSGPRIGQSEKSAGFQESGKGKQGACACLG